MKSFGVDQQALVFPFNGGVIQTMTVRMLPMKPTVTEIRLAIHGCSHAVMANAFTKRGHVVSVEIRIISKLVKFNI